MAGKRYGYCCKLLIGCVFVAVLILPQTTAFGREANVQLLLTLSERSKSNEVKALGCSSPEGTTLAVKRDKTMTAVWCVVKCWRNKYEYSVNQNGNRCLCSHSRNKPRDKKECNIACPGDKKQTCGGGKAASVFFTGYVKLHEEQLQQLYTGTRLAYNRNKSKMTAEMAAYDNLAPCVFLITPENSLSFTSHLMSKELCVVHCFHYKFSYALLSAGEKCTCLSQLPKEAKRYTVPREDCNMLCPGNMGQHCGGRDGSSYNVWLTGHYNQEDHLNQKDYRPVNALFQGWRSYLQQHPDVADELSKLGVTIPSEPATVPHTGRTTPPQITALTTGGNGTDVDVEDDVLTDPDSGAASGVIAGAVIAGLVAASAGLGLVLYLRRSKYSNPYGSKKDREEHKLLKKQISEKTPIKAKKTGRRNTSDGTDNPLAGDGDDEDKRGARNKD